MKRLNIIIVAEGAIDRNNKAITTDYIKNVSTELCAASLQPPVWLWPSAPVWLLTLLLCFWNALSGSLASLVRRLSRFCTLNDSRTLIKPNTHFPKPAATCLVEMHWSEFIYFFVNVISSYFKKLFYLLLFCFFSKLNFKLKNSILNMLACLLLCNSLFELNWNIMWCMLKLEPRRVFWSLCLK